MNERSQGALEALSYIRQYVERLDKKDKNPKLKILAELNYLTKLLLNGSVKDFKQRIENY